MTAALQTIIKCVRVAERTTTTPIEAQNAALKVFDLVRANEISLSSLIEGSPDDTASSVLYMQKVSLESQKRQLDKKVSALTAKVISLEGRLARSREEISTMRAARKPVAPQRPAPAPALAVPPEVKPQDGFVPYSEFAHKALDAFGHKSGWIVAIAEIAGIDKAVVQQWRKRELVPVTMLKHIPELRNYQRAENFHWTKEARDELVRFVKSQAKQPSFAEMAKHMAMFTNHKFSDNAMKGEHDRLRRAGRV